MKFTHRTGLGFTLPTIETGTSLKWSGTACFEPTVPKQLLRGNPGINMYRASPGPKAVLGRSWCFMRLSKYRRSHLGPVILIEHLLPQARALRPLPNSFLWYGEWRLGMSRLQGFYLCWNSCCC